MYFHKVLVIGLGQLGLPVAKYVMEIGYDTYGYDINIRSMEYAKKTIGIKTLDPLDPLESDRNAHNNNC